MRFFLHTEFTVPKWKYQAKWTRTECNGRGTTKMLLYCAADRKWIIFVSSRLCEKFIWMHLVLIMKLYSFSVCVCVCMLWCFHWCETTGKLHLLSRSCCFPYDIISTDSIFKRSQNAIRKLSIYHGYCSIRMIIVPGMCQKYAW